MKTLTVAQFKAQFGHVVNEHVPVLVRKRKVPVGLWQPLDLKRLRSKQAGVLKGFVKLGQSLHRDIARQHDEYLYGKLS